MSLSQLERERYATMYDLACGRCESSESDGEIQEFAKSELRGYLIACLGVGIDINESVDELNKRCDACFSSDGVDKKPNRNTLSCGIRVGTYEGIADNSRVRSQI